MARHKRGRHKMRYVAGRHKGGRHRGRHRFGGRKSHRKVAIL